MKRGKYIVAIDLGTTNVVMAVASVGDDGLLSIEAVSSQPTDSDGMSSGVVENIEHVSNAVKAAKNQIEQQLDIRITEAYVGVSGWFVRCATYADHVFSANASSGISRQDVQALFERMERVKAPEGEVILDLLPQNYMIAGGREVKDPVGACSSQLSSTFLFVLCDKMPIERIQLVMNHAGIRVTEVLSNAQMLAEGIASDEEREDGVAVVDIGSDTTNVAVIKGKVLRYIVSIPMGGAAIDADIMTQGIPERNVTQLKHKCGSAVADMAPEDYLIKIKGPVSRSILQRNLAAVIEARLTDIAEFVRDEIAGLKSDAKRPLFEGRIPCGIILTGGVSQTENIDELFRRITKQDVRVAAADIGLTEESKDKIVTPAYSAVVGLLIGASRRKPQTVTSVPPVIRNGYDDVRRREEEERRRREDKLAEVDTDAKPSPAEDDTPLPVTDDEPPVNPSAGILDRLKRKINDIFKSSDEDDEELN